MKKRKDLALLSQITSIITDFRNKKISFEKLYLVVDSLLGELSNLDQSWRLKINSTWSELEVVYAMFLTLQEANLQKDLSRNILNYKPEVPARYDTGIEDSLKEMEFLIEQKQESTFLAYCPVCGYDLSDSSLWVDKSLSFDSCDCCGKRFHRESDSIDNIRKHRDIWLQHPDYWFNEKAKPENWKLEDQMENIPQEYW